MNRPFGTFYRSTARPTASPAATGCTTIPRLQTPPSSRAVCTQRPMGSPSSVRKVTAFTSSLPCMPQTPSTGGQPVAARRIAPSFQLHTIKPPPAAPIPVTATATRVPLPAQPQVKTANTSDQSVRSIAPAVVAPDAAGAASVAVPQSIPNALIPDRTRVLIPVQKAPPTANTKQIPKKAKVAPSAEEAFKAALATKAARATSAFKKTPSADLAVQAAHAAKAVRSVNAASAAAGVALPTLPQSIPNALTDEECRRILSHVEESTPCEQALQAAAPPIAAQSQPGLRGATGSKGDTGPQDPAGVVDTLDSGNAALAATTLPSQCALFQNALDIVVEANARLTFCPLFHNATEGFTLNEEGDGVLISQPGLYRADVRVYAEEEDAQVGLFIGDAPVVGGSWISHSTRGAMMGGVLIDLRQHEAPILLSLRNTAAAAFTLRTDSDTISNISVLLQRMA